MGINEVITDQGLTQIDTIVCQAVDAPTEEELKTQSLIKVLHDMEVSVHDEIPADINTLRIGDVETFAYEGLHFIKAKAKQGKTSALSIIESVFISKTGKWGKMQRIEEAPLKVLHFDTEQKSYDTQRFKVQVLSLAQAAEEETGDNLRVINMRGIIENQMKMELIEAGLEEYKPDVLVLDGIVDLLNNFNDVDESKTLIAWLMSIADTYKVVLICVLHTNKNSMDHNMRGHLGTMSEQKCDTTTECEKDDDTGIVVVKCANSRHRPYPDWSFTWDDCGNLVDAEQQRYENAVKKAEEQKAVREQKAQDIKDARKNKMLSIIKEHNGSISRSELTSKLEAELNLSRKTISPLITTWLSENIIFEINNRIQTTPQSMLFNEE